MMNSFCVEELLLSFDELKPFSEPLRNDTHLTRLHKLYRKLDKHDDASLIRHILVVVSCMENCLQADPPLLKNLQNCLVELTSLIEKTKGTVSDNCTNLALGILFKYSGVLLHIQQDSDPELVLFLNAVAYHYLCSSSLVDSAISAWVALQTLEAGAVITYSYVIENEIIGLCSRDDLAELCVDSLIPSDGCIQRLHAGVFRDAIAAAPAVWPAIAVSQIEKQFERVIPYIEKPDVLRIILWMIGHDNTFEEMTLLDTVLSKSPLNESNDPDSSMLTPIDVKCFLYTLSLWSDSWNYPAQVPARLHIKADQFNCWKALCHLIKKTPESSTVKCVLLRSRVMDSVRLRHRVISLRRLYEVFRWLEVHVKNQQWLSLYATAVNEIITGIHSQRRKCDELFPGGNEVEDLTVDEVDHMQDHVSRYMASQYLAKSEYNSAEQLLVYSTSIESKKLLIKLYQMWLEKGNFEEPEINQLTKRIRGLEVECAEREMRGRTPSTNSGASAGSGGDAVAPAVPPSSRKIFVDAFTNTPSRVDTSTSAVDDASFFSVKSDRTSTTAAEESFASAIASPHGPNIMMKSPLAPPSRNPLPTSSVEALMSSNGATAQEKTVAMQSLSTTSITTAVNKCDDVALPENLGHSPLGPAKSVSSSPGVIVHNPTVPVVPSVTASSIPIVVTKTPFGPPVINKEAATSFWKSGKGHPFGPANKTATDVQTSVLFGANASLLDVPNHTAAATNSTGLPVMQPPSGIVTQPKLPLVGSTSVFGISAQGLHVSSTSSLSAPAYMNNPHSAPLLSQPEVVNPQMPLTSFGMKSPLLKPCAVAATSVSSSTPNPNALGMPAFATSPSSSANVSAVNEYMDEDEHFCNDLMIEMCRKQLERAGKKSNGKEAPFDDLVELQKRVAQIDRQMRNVHSQLHVNTDIKSTCSSHLAAPKSAPTQAEIIRQHQKEALLELEQQVAQYFKHARGHQTGTVPGSSAHASHEVDCPDPINLIRGLLLSSNTTETSSVSKLGVSTDKSTSSDYSVVKPSPDLVRKSIFEDSMFKMVQASNHPGCKGICLGCADDNIQDRALHILAKLSEEWNAETDSDND